jgi:hypothetical protein
MTNTKHIHEMTPAEFREYAGDMLANVHGTDADEMSIGRSAWQDAIDRPAETLIEVKAWAVVAYADARTKFKAIGRSMLPRRMSKSWLTAARAGLRVYCHTWSEMRTVLRKLHTLDCYSRTLRERPEDKAKYVKPLRDRTIPGAGDGAGRDVSSGDWEPEQYERFE